MKISGWGKYPVINTEVIKPSNVTKLKKIIEDPKLSAIPRGCGKSYGDSSLSPQSVLDITRLKHIINFNEHAESIECYAGITLADLIEFTIPRGFFLPVTPGTKFITLGGAISSDVHGKNHHIDGCFSQFIIKMKVMLPNGEVINCSKDQNTDIFKAICGGMGLVGIILTAEIKLRPIKSGYIEQISVRTKCLEETISAMEEHKNTLYSVAWIDCLDKQNPGKGIVYLGKHCESGKLQHLQGRALNIPSFFPPLLLNSFTTKVFNKLLYWKHGSKTKKNIISINKFFYPLDNLNNWNNLYGKKGFLQYQFVIPKDKISTLQTILDKVSSTGQGSFLAVLKVFGKKNTNFLSFPTEGYTLALDFKYNDNVLKLLDELDALVVRAGGRLYLAKDARMSEETFKHSYPDISQFKNIREKLGSDLKFNSLQSKRLNL